MRVPFMEDVGKLLPPNFWRPSEVIDRTLFIDWFEKIRRLVGGKTCGSESHRADQTRKLILRERKFLFQTLAPSSEATV